MSARPWCCPDRSCSPLSNLKDSDDLPDIRVSTPGESFICFGRMERPVRFEYDGSIHINDLRSCHYSPLKGLVAWQENAEDWAWIIHAYKRALGALNVALDPDRPEACDQCGADIPPLDAEVAELLDEGDA